jgi:general secretion pathway protein D
MKNHFRSLCLLSTLILASALSAQTQRRVPAGPLPSSSDDTEAATLAATTPELTASDSLASAIITPLEPEVENPDVNIGTLVLIDESALQVIDLLEKMTGKIILRRQDISPAKINFNSRGPLKKGDAVLALESLLTLNGIMLTDMGGRFMKAVPATDVNRHVPEMIIGSTLELQPSQQIYAKLYKFEYLNAEQVSGTMISPLLSQNSSFVAFPKSNALLITDALINLQRIESIVKDADRAQDIREEIKFIKLEYVQATEMQDRIENLIQGPLKSYLEGNTSVTADERTNQLILITHPGNIETIMNVIESIDIDAAPLTASEVFPLRQAKAEEVVPIIENIISGQKEGREEDAKVARENNQAGNKNNTPNVPGLPTAPEVAATSTSSSESNSSLQFSNFVGLSADERTNAIVAYGTHNDLKTIKELIEKIDIPLPQVLIEAVITEVTLKEDQASGLTSFGFKYDGIAAGTIPAGFSGIGISTAGASGTGSNISAGSVDLNNPNDFSLTALVSASDTDSKARILSTPRIMVSHNEEGIINVSESRPIITSSTSSLSNSDINNSRSSVEYRDIGIKLTVTPLIGADGTVQMKIEQTVENVVGTIKVDNNDQPIIGIREATSTVSVQDNQVIVLGGLQQNSVTKGNSYVPGFRRIPFLGGLLGGDTSEYDRTELIIFIRPKILPNPSVAQKLSDEYIDKAEEKKAVVQYLENNTSGDLYMKGSRFEEEAKPTKNEEPKKRPFIRFGF